MSFFFFLIPFGGGGGPDTQDCELNTLKSCFTVHSAALPHQHAAQGLTDPVSLVLISAHSLSETNAFSGKVVEHSALQDPLMMTC